MPNEYLLQEYRARINRAIDYIDHHLDDPLCLAEIAAVASFSPFHFHRIFHAMVGEPLSGFIQRVRVEKAATQLLANPKKSITEIAMDCGFAGSATFARAFKERYHMSAGQWRKGGFRTFASKTSKPDSKKCKMDGNPSKADDLSFAYVEGVQTTSLTQRRSAMKNQQLQVRVLDLPDMPVVYVRHIGPYKGDEKLFADLFKKLMTWTGARGLLADADAKVLIVYHDNPEITEASNLRTSVCVTVPRNTPVDGDIGYMILPGGRYAFGRFELAADEYQMAWDALCGEWLPESGYQPDDRPSFELCLNDPAEHPQHKHVVDICIPVKPM